MENNDKHYETNATLKALDSVIDYNGALAVQLMRLGMYTTESATEILGMDIEDILDLLFDLNLIKYTEEGIKATRYAKKHKLIKNIKSPFEGSTFRTILITEKWMVMIEEFLEAE